VRKKERGKREKEEKKKKRREKRWKIFQTWKFLARKIKDNLLSWLKIIFVK
jgi:hypothetical protein